MNSATVSKEERTPVIISVRTTPHWHEGRVLHFRLENVDYCVSIVGRYDNFLHVS